MVAAPNDSEWGRRAVVKDLDGHTVELVTPPGRNERQQFGRTLGSFQLVQEKLARMLGNITASLSLVVRLTEQQARGIYRDQDSALAKMQTSLFMRETVALAREVVGGNGITLETDVARFHADAEAVYSYEGTHDINALIIGRALTGVSAFTH